MKKELDVHSEQAYFAYAKAHYNAGCISTSLLDAPHLLSSYVLHSINENCAGIHLPTFFICEARTVWLFNMKLKTENA